MPEDQDPVASLTAAAEAVRQQLGVTAFDAAAVTELARFVEGQRGQVGASSAERQGVVTALGCFLGECLVRTYQGEWAAGPDGTTGVGLANRIFFNPFYLVEQQLRQGEKASVATFFASVPTRIAARSAPRKGWIS
jgi:hypothetical protein